jgi:hypothetical protein
VQDRPTRHELLDALRRFLDEEIVPSVEGRRQFLARVAANLLRTIDRELELEEEHLAREWAGLDGLLGVEPRPSGLAASPAALRRRNEALCDRIRAGEADAGPARERYLAHVRTVVRDKLSVTNPAYIEG